MVLQKYIANSGYCSRREAEKLIRGGRVRVNGVVAELGQRAEEGDEIKVGGKKIGAAGEKIYIKVNKPVGYVCTNRRFDSEKSIFELVDVGVRLVCAGRLDKNSRGLVLLSNDGEWINKVTHPRFGGEKEYLVKVSMRSEQREAFRAKEVIKKLLAGVKDDGEHLKVKKVEMLDEAYFKVVLEYGKKRHIRRLFQALGLHVRDLRRVRVGDIKLGALDEGKWEGILTLNP